VPSPWMGESHTGYRCKLKSVNTADETATAVFMDGEERAVFFSDLKVPKTLQCS
jgi:hypothetical protein